MPKTNPGSMVRIDGDKELFAQFKTLSKGFKKESLLQALRRAGEPIVKEAKARAPVRSGRLRESIALRELESTTKEAAVGVSWRVGKASRVPAFYGAVVEKGSKQRERKTWRDKPLLTGPVTTGMAPKQAFLEPAYDAKKAIAERRVKSELLKMIRKAIKTTRG